MSEVASRAYGRLGPAVTRELVTPEGVPLRLGMARAGSRLAAFMVDFIFILLLCIGIWIVCAIAGALLFGEWIIAVAFVASFLVRNFYMSYFEIRNGGATPGKRYNGLRVVDRRGGALTAEAVFARNLTREIELWGPLLLLWAPETLWSDSPAWAALAAMGWMICFAVLPFTNRDRLRFGDLIAGTMVVELPKAVLLGDLSAAPAERRRDGVRFTQEQLDVYGIYELQVLEELLRDERSNRDTLEVVAQKIKRKIGWIDRPGAALRTSDFLHAFYDAQRGRLEGKLLMGERKERKGTGRRARRPRGDR